jgi:alpha,alpha-trehalose phosphorylase
MRDHGGTLSFKPRLPGAISRLAFRLRFRDSTLAVVVEAHRATYTLIDGTALDIVHHGDKATISTERRTELPIPPIAKRPEPRQPPGREPGRRADT